MTLTAAPRATGSAAWADALLLPFAQAGYIKAEPDILQPAEPFLDLSGEDIRKSLYLTTDASGEVDGITVREAPLLMTDPDATARMVAAAIDLAGLEVPVRSGR